MRSMHFIYRVYVGVCKVPQVRYKNEERVYTKLGMILFLSEGTYLCWFRHSCTNVAANVTGFRSMAVKYVFIVKSVVCCLWDSISGKICATQSLNNRKFER